MPDDSYITTYVDEMEEYFGEAGVRQVSIVVKDLDFANVAEVAKLDEFFAWIEGQDYTPGAVGGHEGHWYKVREASEASISKIAIVDMRVCAPCAHEQINQSKPTDLHCTLHLHSLRSRRGTRSTWSAKARTFTTTSTRIWLRS